MEQNTFNRTLLILLASVLVIGIVVFAYYNFSQKPPESFYNSLLNKNESFAYAEGLLKSQRYDEAAEYFKLALKKAEGYKEEGQLKYKIAMSYSYGSNPVAGIALFKEVAANENYTPTIRAYAVQNIGNLLYSYNTPEVKTEVFKDEPYKSFWLEDDYSLSRRKVFDYASSLYPLGIPELRIAKWYSEEILRLQKLAGAENEQKIVEMKSIIGQKLINTNKYLLDIARDEQARGYTAEVLYRKGNVLGDLLLSGDTTFADPEEAYKQALSIVTIKASPEAAAKLRYAVFLTRMYGGERVEDVKKLLSDFYVGTKYASTNTVRSIRNEKDGDLGNKDDYLLLASIDTRFAQFLRTLGWNNIE